VQRFLGKLLLLFSQKMKTCILHRRKALVLWPCLKIILSHLTDLIIWTAVSVVNHFYFYDIQEVTSDAIVTYGSRIRRTQNYWLAVGLA